MINMGSFFIISAYVLAIRDIGGFVSVFWILSGTLITFRDFGDWGDLGAAVQTGSNSNENTKIRDKTLKFFLKMSINLKMLPFSFEYRIEPQYEAHEASSIT